MPEKLWYPNRSSSYGSCVKIHYGFAIEINNNNVISNMESKHKVERDCQLDRLNAELRLYRITVLILSVILIASILLFGIMFLEDSHMGLCSGTVILTGDSDVSMI